MNLYLFNDNDIAATYGIGTYLNELIHALKESTICVHVVHLHSVRPEFEIVKTDEIENWYIPEVRNHNTFDGNIQKIEEYYQNVIFLLRINIKDTADLIFHFNFNQCYALAKGLKKVFDCKTVSTIHFMKWTLELQGNMQKFHALNFKAKSERSTFEELLYTTNEYESFLYHEVDRVIALSQYMKDLLCSEYQLNPHKIFVIPNGLEDLVYRLEFDKIALRRKWHLTENEFLILFVGRLHEMKGLTFLIDAFQKVIDKIPDSRLIIVGSGDFKSYLQASKNICAKVSFTGLMEKTELHELYQIANIGVMPSLFETFGYVVVEMMMHELPIVATATSGLNDVFDETCGLKVPLITYPDKVEIDTDLLADRIVYLLEHPEEAREMGKNGRKRYIKHYSTGVFQKKMLRLYESLYDKSAMNSHCTTVNDITFLRPVNITNKIRIGNPFDGGYIVYQPALSETDVLITYGVGWDVAFEVHFHKMTGKKVWMYDPTLFDDNRVLSDIRFEKMNQWKRQLELLRKEQIVFVDEGISTVQKPKYNTFENHLKINHIIDEMILLKMDIEGGEYEIFEDESIYKSMEKVNQIIIEFHDLKIKIDVLENIIRRLKKDFELIHIHGNNCGGIFTLCDSVSAFEFPNVVELTFVKKKAIHSGDIIIESVTYPEKGLDYPNNPKWERLYNFIR